MQGNAELYSFDHCWVRYSQVATDFQSSPFCVHLPKEDRKELTKLFRDITVSDGLVEVGRRKLDGDKGFVRVSWFQNHDVCYQNLNRDIYLRLTPSGRSFVQMAVHSKKCLAVLDAKKHLYIGNILPCSTQAMDLVQLFERDLHATVQRVIIEYNNINCCCAHVELLNSQDGARIMDEKSTIEFAGLFMKIQIDRQAPKEGPVVEKNDQYHYRRNSVEKSPRVVAPCTEILNIGDADVAACKSAFKEEVLPSESSDCAHDHLLLGSAPSKEVTSDQIETRGIVAGHSTKELEASKPPSPQSDELRKPPFPHFDELAERREIQLSQLQHRLAAVIAVHDFQEALLLQREIETLERLRELHFLNIELGAAVAQKDFVQAGSIHECIESLQKNICCCTNDSHATKMEDTGILHN